jgi:DNA polymerase-1
MGNNVTKTTRLFNDVTVEVANVAEASDEMVDALFRASTIYFDTETTALHPWKGGEIALVQMYDPQSKRILLGRVGEHQPPPEWLCGLFDNSRTFVGHNIGGFDLHFMHQWGVPWKQASYVDTLIAESLISTSGRRDVSKSLRASVRRRTGFEVNKDIEHGNWRVDEMNDRQIEYAATDVIVLPQLCAEQISKAAESGQTSAYEMEMSVMPVFAMMTINGLPINPANLVEYMRQSKVKCDAAEELLVKRLGQINFNSPAKVKAALKAIGIDLESTAKNALIDQIQFDPESENAKLLQALLDWRAPHKRTEMYGNSDWQDEYIQPDGRIHARFWQIGADTTRVSSSDPNLQQVPKDGRWVFGGVEGHKIVSIDYSQIEVRIAASIANDPVLIEMLSGHDDVHTAIASAVFKVRKEDVTPKQRKRAKAMVFTLLFGGSPQVLYDYARRSGGEITYDEAVEMFASFFSTFDGLAVMRKKAYAYVKNHRGAVITLPNGARRVLFGAKFSPQIILNTPVQGTASVGMKLGLIEAERRGLDRYLGAVVHDEAVACVPDSEAEEYAAEMQDSLVCGMQQVVKNCRVKAEIARNPDGSLPNVWLA